MSNALPLQALRAALWHALRHRQMVHIVCYWHYWPARSQVDTLKSATISCHHICTALARASRRDACQDGPSIHVHVMDRCSIALSERLLRCSDIES